MNERPRPGLANAAVAARMSRPRQGSVKRPERSDPPPNPNLLPMAVALVGQPVYGGTVAPADVARRRAANKRARAARRVQRRRR